MNIGDDVRIDLAGTVTAVEPGRLTIRATEGGAVWSVGTVVDVPAGALVEQTPPALERHHRDECAACWAQAHEGHDVGWRHEDGSLYSATCHDCDAVYLRATS